MEMKPGEQGAVERKAEMEKVPLGLEEEFATLLPPHHPADLSCLRPCQLVACV